MKLCCFSVIVLLCVLDVWCSEWSADIPASITAVSGLCVHIPCSFTYPGPKVPAKKMTAIWFQGWKDHQVYNSRCWELVDVLFWNRTRLLGSLDRNECSLKIGPLGSGDTHGYTFRIEIEGRDRYTYKDRTVVLNVNDAPPFPVMQCPGVLSEGVPVSLVCAVIHTCPEASPILRWSPVQAKQVDIQPQGRRQLQGGWEERAVLNLLPSAGTNGELLRCSALFPNGMSGHGPDCRLTVNYAPRNVTVRVLSPLGSISEGDTLVLSCQADSHPAPHWVSWFQGLEGRELPVLDQRGKDLLLKKIKRSPGPFWCEAENSVGSVSSQPLTLDVLYEPEITKESWCSVIYKPEAELSCECVAYGNPSPSIYLTVSPSNELITGHMNTAQSEGHKSVVNLSSSAPWNHTTTKLVILCVAENSLASKTKVFTLTSNINPETAGAFRIRSSWTLWGPVMFWGLIILLSFIRHLIFSHRTVVLMDRRQHERH